MTAVFNLNFLKSPKDDPNFTSYNELGVPISQKSRASDFSNFGVKELPSYVEFKNYDFEKWYSNKKAQKKLPDDFSLIVGLDEIGKKDSNLLDIKI